MSEYQETSVIEGQIISIKEFCTNNNLVMHITSSQEVNSSTENSTMANSVDRLIQVTLPNLEGESFIYESQNKLEELLNEWGLLHLKEKFAGGGYDRVDDLEILTESDLDAMFPEYRDGSQKTRLRAKIVEWRQSRGFKAQVDLLSGGSTKSVTTSVHKWLESQNGSSTELPSPT